MKMKKSELKQIIREEIKKMQQLADIVKEDDQARRNSLEKNDIVKYDGDRYIIIDRVDDDIWIRPLRNPFGGSYHTSPMSYPSLKIKIDNPNLKFFS